MSNESEESRTQHVILQAMIAVLSDDHNHERGVTILTDLIEAVARKKGGHTLSEVAVALSLALANALERAAVHEGLMAEDLVEVWFAE